MKTSKTIRTLVAAGCVAGTPGCVGGPQQRPPPPPEECPPGAVDAHKRYGIHGHAFGIHLGHIRQGLWNVPVRHGEEVRAEIVGKRGKLPDWTTFSGRLFLSQGRFYGRFTAAHLPSGETIPVCLEVLKLGGQGQGRGRPVEPGSTATRALVYPSISVEAVERFE